MPLQQAGEKEDLQRLFSWSGVLCASPHLEAPGGTATISSRRSRRCWDIMICKTGRKEQLVSRWSSINANQHPAGSSVSSIQWSKFNHLPLYSWQRRREGGEPPWKDSSKISTHTQNLVKLLTCLSVSWILYYFWIYVACFMTTSLATSNFTLKFSTWSVCV